MKVKPHLTFPNLAMDWEGNHKENSRETWDMTGLQNAKEETSS